MLHVVSEYCWFSGLVWLRWLLVHVFLFFSIPCSVSISCIVLSCYLLFIAVWRFPHIFWSPLHVHLHRQGKITIIAQPGLWGWTANCWVELPKRFVSLGFAWVWFISFMWGAFTPSVSLPILPSKRVWMILSKQNTKTECRCYFDYCLHVVYWPSSSADQNYPSGMKCLGQRRTFWTTQPSLRCSIPQKPEDVSREPFWH